MKCEAVDFVRDVFDFANQPSVRYGQKANDGIIPAYRKQFSILGNCDRANPSRECIRYCPEWVGCRFMRVLPAAQASPGVCGDALIVGSDKCQALQPAIVADKWRQ